MVVYCQKIAFNLVCSSFEIPDSVPMLPKVHKQLINDAVLYIK